MQAANWRRDDSSSKEGQGERGEDRIQMEDVYGCQPGPAQGILRSQR